MPQRDEFIPECFSGFGLLRIGNDGIIDRADALAGRSIVMAYTFGTSFCINLINNTPHRNGLVRAFRFAHIAINTAFSNQ